MFWDIVPIVAVTASALHLLPQVWKSIKTKRTKDLSWSMLLLHFVANVSWLTYGLHIASVPLMALGFVNATSNTVLMFYKKHRG